MKLRRFYFENGWFVGYYIQDANGVNWAVHDTPKEAYSDYKRLTAWNYQIKKLTNTLI